MNLMVFTHFQAAAVQLYGNIPLGKGDDDASLFETLIKESRFPSDSRSITWDTLKDVLEKYKVSFILCAIMICILTEARDQVHALL